IGPPIRPSPKNPSFAISEDCIMSVESLFLECAVDKLGVYCDRIGICLGKLSDEQIWARGQENENAIGNLVLHLAGNVRRRIISSLGGNPDPRDRNSEFDARAGFTAPQLANALSDAIEKATAIIAGLTTEQL